MSATTTPLIELRDVHVVYTSRTGTLFRPERVPAVAGVSLQVLPGRTLGIVGESGSGKTTTARVMLGLEQPERGEVLFKGEQMGRRSATQRKKIGRVVAAVFQDPATALNPRMMIRDALRDPLDVHGVGTPRQRADKVRELIGLVGLPKSALDMLPTQLSGGQRQRVAIARALMLDPDVIVADEPTSALDVSVRAQILNLLADIKAELGLAMVFISHDIQTVRYVSDEIAVMNKGEVVELGRSEDIFTNPAEDYTRSLLGAAPALLSG
ncbi:MAG TPA: ATP-binding cassette domain-containing protein [Beutenbergiaceae bacterium]|nr:ATP-binding cassette domain-containing protein [Beutenbergiaceae bacterium]